MTTRNSRTPILPVLLFALSLLPAADATAQCIDYSESAHWSGRISVGGDTRNMIWHDGYLLTAGNNLNVIDARDPDAAAFIRSVDTPGFVQDVAAGDGHLYVADSHGGLQVMTFANPAWPWILGSLPEEQVGRLITVGLEGDRLLAADDTGRLHLIDVSDPSAPVRRAYTPLEANCADLAIHDGVVYAALYTGGVVVFELTEPAGMERRATLPLTWARGVTVSGDLLFVAAYNEGLVIYDRTDPLAPVELGRLVLPDSAKDVAVDGDTAWLAHGWPGLARVDVSDPTAPTFVSTHPTYSNGDAVVLGGGRVWLGDDMVHRFVPGEPQQEIAAVLHPLEVRALDLLRDGDLVYAITGEPALRVVDWSVPDAPVDRGVLPLGSHVSGLCRVGDLLATTTGSRGHLLLFDLSDPDAPALLLDQPLDEPLSYLAAHGSVLYVSSYSGLRIFDLTDPLAPVEMPLLHETSGLLHVEGDLLYFVGDPFKVWDLSDPRAPVEISSCPGQWSGDVDFEGGLALTGSSYGGACLYDVSDPTAIRELAVFHTPSRADAVLLEDETAYVMDRSRGVYVYDLRTPDSPVCRGLYAAASGSDLARGPAGFLLGAEDLVMAPWHCEREVGVVLDRFARTEVSGVVRLVWETAGDPRPASAYSVSVESAGATRVLPPAVRFGAGYAAVDPAPPAGAARYVLRLDDADGGRILGVVDHAPATPAALTALGAPRPNPFNPATRIPYTLERPGHVTLTIHDLAGREVARLVDGIRPAGPDAAEWRGLAHDGRPLPSGAYLARLRAGDVVSHVKLMLVE